MASFSISTNGHGPDYLWFWFGKNIADWQRMQDKIGDGKGWTFIGPGGIYGSVSSIVAIIDENGDYQISVTIVTTTSPIPDGGYTFIPPSVACFVEGTRILTRNGYKTIETLQENIDLVITSDNRAIRFKLLKTTLQNTDILTAPYLIQAGAFGKDFPSNSLRISGTHKMLIRKGVWVSPESLVLKSSNPLVKQYGIGQPVTYFHIECDNYLQDNIIAEGITVESFGTVDATNGVRDIYTWNDRLNGFTRIGYGSCHPKGTLLEVM